MSIFELRSAFHVYNMDYFDSCLDDPQFKIIHSKNTLGKFSYYVNYDGGIEDPIIEISDAYLYTENQLRDVLVHEMVHYYLAYTGQDLRVTHGRAFKNLAAKLNKQYSCNIQKRIDTTEYIRNKKAKRSFWARLFSF